MDKLPDMFVGFDLAKRGHAGQPDAIFHNPEEFSQNSVAPPLNSGLPHAGSSTRQHPSAATHSLVAKGAFHPV
jgi:hypothetical protein